MQLLLLSNSTLPGQAYLGWPQTYLHSFLEHVTEAVFIPFAGITITYNDYTAAVAKALQPMGVSIKGVHSYADKQQAIAEASCIIVGGGNTFQLLKILQDENLLTPVQTAVQAGAKYLGWSAGANLACPTIKTTNDMPVVAPASFDALQLINYQINPHFTHATLPNHGGETREMRIKEYLTVNPSSSVIGLPEGMLLHIDNSTTYLKGRGEAWLFKHAQPVQSLLPGELLF